MSATPSTSANATSLDSSTQDRATSGPQCFSTSSFHSQKARIRLAFEKLVCRWAPSVTGGSSASRRSPTCSLCGCTLGPLGTRQIGDQEFSRKVFDMYPTLQRPSPRISLRPSERSPRRLEAAPETFLGGLLRPRRGGGGVQGASRRWRYLRPRLGALLAPPRPLRSCSPSPPARLSDARGFREAIRTWVRSFAFTNMCSERLLAQ
eukprot:1649907-Pyramimonas_sp.AAC.1